jgi:ABC-type lipoprotein release transport system permease subunit
MRFVPLRYPLRSIAVRWSSSLFAALGIGLTVAVLGGVLALRAGFAALLQDTGRDDVGVYLRPASQSETESLVRYPDDVRRLTTRPEIARDAAGTPIAASESSLGIFLPKSDGSGTALVSIRGVEPASLVVHGERLKVVAGSMLRFGTDEVVVGRPLTRRIGSTGIGETIQINLTPFKVVGHFEHPGAYGSEIWGDVIRIGEATKRSFRQRVVAVWRDGTDASAVARELESDKLVPMKVQTEREYYRAQTAILGGVLSVLAVFLTSVMGAAAVLGAVNTMLAAVGARTREVGVLVSLGYRGFAVFVSFLVEAALIGFAGAAIGCLLVLPINGIETGTTNFATFTEIAFAFQVTPRLLLTSATVAVVLGVLGGAIPAWRASRLQPTAALRRL